MVAAGSKLGESEVSRVVASVGEVIMNPLTTSGKILTQGGVLASTYPARSEGAEGGCRGCRV